jgi:hypothetical protein
MHGLESTIAHTVFSLRLVFGWDEVPMEVEEVRSCFFHCHILREETRPNILILPPSFYRVSIWKL